MREQGITVPGQTVTFLLPFASDVPIGGFKIVYEYANRLADRGWHVRLIYPCLLTQNDIEACQWSLKRRIRLSLSHQRQVLTGSFRPQWFQVSPKVEMLCTKTPHLQRMPPSDIWVATWWYTARWVAMYPGVGLYLIQHLETWGGAEADVLATWKLPLRKIVSSRWLEKIAHGMGETADYITYGLDFDTFGIDIAPEKRHPYTAAMLYHESDWKGTADGLQALRIVKEQFPALKATLFGAFPAPNDLPSWIEYHFQPSPPLLRQIYNRAAVFLGPSWTEGWGLPPAEALQCGSALAVTDNGGHREYAQDGITALISPPKNPDALAINMIRLLTDQALRLQLAYQGHEHIRQFTWGRAVSSFEAVLQDALCQVPAPSVPSQSGSS